MHPDLEIHHLICVSRRCEQLARCGRVDEGHRALRLALCRAEELQKAGVFWAPQLVSLWRCALREYRRRHLEQAQVSRSEPRR